jgi:hypothetical protein
MADPVTIADIYALFQTSQAEADRRFAEADRQMQELKLIAANTSREVAGLTTRWGQFVENLVEPSVVRLFQERGIEVQETARRMKSQRPGVDRFAYQQGLFVIRQTGDTVAIVNDTIFQPAAW